MPPVHLSGSRSGTRTAVVCDTCNPQEGVYTRPPPADCQPSRDCQQCRSAQPTSRADDTPSSRPARGREAAQPAAREVVEALREAIIVGELADGERLIEDRIARELKTSRGPVREALRQLEHEGLVVSYPYRGAVVLGVSDEEVQRGPDPDPPDARAVQLHEGARADGRRRLRRAREGGLADGRGGADGRPAAARSRPTSASMSSCSRARASRTRRRSGAASRRASAPTSSATAARPTSTRIAVEHGELLEALQTRDRRRLMRRASSATSPCGTPAAVTR